MADKTSDQWQYHQTHAAKVAKSNQVTVTQSYHGPTLMLSPLLLTSCDMSLEVTWALWRCQRSVTWCWSHDQLCWNVRWPLWAEWTSWALPGQFVKNPVDILGQFWVHSGSSAQPRPFITVIRAEIRAGYPRRVDKPKWRATIKGVNIDRPFALCW